MKDWVAAKMEQIRELYPESKKKERKQRWLDFYQQNQTKDRRPFVCTSYYEPYCAAPDFEGRLRECLDDIIIRGSIDDDYIPSLFTGCRQSTIPSMFGAPEIIINEDVTCEKIIHSPEDISKLPKHWLIGVAKRWLEMEEYFLEETNGELPIHVTDMQGPFDVAGQLWSYDEVFPLAYEHPEIYDELMQRLTDAFLDFWNAQKKLLGDNFVGTHLFAWNWVPEDFGASMSVDSLAMLSDPFYREFYQPYIERAAVQMGGVSIHSCGDFSAVIPVLCQTPGVTALNAGQMSPRAMCDAGLTQNMLAITYIPVEEIDDLFALYREKKLHVSISLSNVWNYSKPFAEWTAADFDRIKRIEAYMHEQLSN